MSSNTKLRAYAFVAPIMFGAIALATTSAFAAAPCQGPGAPTNTETKCLTAVPIPGAALKGFDISWTDPERAEYYLADRSNKRIDVIDTRQNTYKRRVGEGQFVGVRASNSVSGPDGVVNHGRWLYTGDGDSTLKVFDLDGPATLPAQPPISTGGTTRVDEMAITTDGFVLLAANNAEDPPYATLFAANGDAAFSNVRTIIRIGVASSIIPKGFGLSIEQPAWDPKTKRFYVSIPIIANNPKGCDLTVMNPPFCSGGMLVIDPANLPAPVLLNGVVTSVYGAFDPATNTGVVALNECGPNGATVGPHDNLLLGCTPGNDPANTSTLVINAKTKHFANIGDITGSDEVFYNAGDRRYYTASSANPTGAVLGVIDAETNLLIETIPQSSGSHSVAADAERNRIYVPQSASDTTNVGAGICGGSNGCIAVYQHHVEDKDDHGDRAE
jgi:DNA-binding beta-propeller fold protein YncE